MMQRGDWKTRGSGAFVRGGRGRGSSSNNGKTDNGGGAAAPARDTGRRVDESFYHRNQFSQRGGGRRRARGNVFAANGRKGKEQYRSEKRITKSSSLRRCCSCNIEASAEVVKYTLPCCLLPFCSVACFRLHRQQQHPTAADSAVGDPGSGDASATREAAASSTAAQAAVAGESTTVEHAAADQAAAEQATALGEETQGTSHPKRAAGAEAEATAPLVIPLDAITPALTCRSAGATAGSHAANATAAAPAADLPVVIAYTTADPPVATDIPTAAGEAREGSVAASPKRVEAAAVACTRETSERTRETASDYAAAPHGPHDGAGAADTLEKEAQKADVSEDKGAPETSTATAGAAAGRTECVSPAAAQAVAATDAGSHCSRKRPVVDSQQQQQQHVEVLEVEAAGGGGAGAETATVVAAAVEALTESGDAPTKKRLLLVRPTSYCKWSSEARQHLLNGSSNAGTSPEEDTEEAAAAAVTEGHEGGVIDVSADDDPRAAASEGEAREAAAGGAATAEGEEGELDTAEEESEGEIREEEPVRDAQEATEEVGGPGRGAVLEEDYKRDKGDEEIAEEEELTHEEQELLRQSTEVRQALQESKRLREALQEVVAARAAQGRSDDGRSSSVTELMAAFLSDPLFESFCDSVMNALRWDANEEEDEERHKQQQRELQVMQRQEQRRRHGEEEEKSETRLLLA